MPTPTVKDIHVFSHEQEWDTKSGGTLRVLYSLDYPIAKLFLAFDEQAVLSSPDIRGLRSYIVQDIPLGKVGANEWHKVRNEIIIVLNGAIRWHCLDLEGNEAEFVVAKGKAVFTPNHILHTYEALEENTTLSVLANTIFIANNPTTHDTYSADTFNHL